MISVYQKRTILEKRAGIEFENGGVLNPTCILIDGVTHMFYRAVDKSGISTIGYCQLKDNKVISRCDKPIIFPEHDYEKMGVEDPRITYLDGKYYLFYTAYDGKNATIALATSFDLVNFEKKGVIIPNISYDQAEDIFKKDTRLNPQYRMFEKKYRALYGNDILLWEKDGTLFPKKINGKFAMLHRILPGIQIIYFDDWADLTIDYWKKYLSKLNDHIVMDPIDGLENTHIGAGCSPIETKDGWLLIYHSVGLKNNHLTYWASAALLDKDNPQKVIGRLPYPLFKPTLDWEIKGVVGNVVFPTGAVVKDENLYIYYGAADSRIGLAKINLSKLLNTLHK
jgi:predicted GH43/DUF377 family glycosyl hydrolase